MTTFIIIVSCVAVGYFFGSSNYTLPLTGFTNRFKSTREVIQIILKDDKFDHETKIKKIDNQMAYLYDGLKGVLGEK